MADPRNFWHILPYYAKKDVVHYLDFKTRCNLSYCSKSDLALVKSTPIAFRQIYWVGHRSRTLICFNTINCTTEQRIDRGYDIKQNLDRLLYLLRSPNTCRRLYFGTEPRDDAEQQIRLIEELDVENNRPKVKVLMTMRNIGDVFYELLKRLDANYLEGISVCSYDGTEQQVERIVATEQWKNAKVVKILGPFGFTWRLEDILDKPKFSIYLQGTTVEEVHQYLNTFQSKNHPVGACFNLDFYSSSLNVQELYEDPGQHLVEADRRDFYLKKFPLPDEALELRVQLRTAHPDTILKIGAISGIVVQKEADFEYADVVSMIKSYLMNP